MPGVLFQLTWPGERSAPAAVAPKPPLLPGQRGSLSLRGAGWRHGVTRAVVPTSVALLCGEGRCCPAREWPHSRPGDAAAACVHFYPSSLYSLSLPRPALAQAPQRLVFWGLYVGQWAWLDLSLPTAAVGFSLGCQIFDHLSVYLPSCFRTSVGPILVGFCLFRKPLSGSVGGA